MLCSSCGSTLLPGSNVCLHCGRIETSVTPDARVAPAWEDAPRRRILPWVVGVLLVALVAGLSYVLFWPKPAPPPPPRKPSQPVVLGLVPPIERAPGEGWGIARAELVPPGSDRFDLVVPAESDADRADLVVAVASGPSKTHLRGMDSASGAAKWNRVLTGRFTCAYDRADALVCLSRQKELTRVALATGAPERVRPTTVEAPDRVWVAPDGAVYALAVTDPDPTAARTLSFVLSRVDAAGNTSWSQRGDLPAGPGVRATLLGTDNLVAVQTSVSAEDGSPATPTLLRRQDGGAPVAAAPDGADVTLLPDGRFGVRSGGRTAVYDAHGTELFAVTGRLVPPGIRDVAVDKAPTYSVVSAATAAGAKPQPPQLLRVEATGATPAEGHGVPVGVCAGALVTEDAVSDPRSFAAKPLASGGQAWQVQHVGDYVSGACDGKRFVALTREDGRYVARGYLVGVGDTVWKSEARPDREYLRFVTGAGWLFRDTKEDRFVLLKG